MRVQTEAKQASAWELERCREADAQHAHDIITGLQQKCDAQEGNLVQHAAALADMTQRHEADQSRIQELCEEINAVSSVREPTLCH